jgi:transcriptional regulator with XRE-family HTH domain
MTVEKFAAAAGIHWTYLSGIERGVRNPTWKILTSIAQASEVSTSDLIRHAEDLAENRQAAPTQR